MIRIVIGGIKRTTLKLARAANEFPDAVEKATLKAVLYVHSKMPKYPPPPAGSTYRRTGMLSRSITSLMGKDPAALSRVESAFGSVQGIVGSMLGYSPFVIDEDSQASGHKGRWYTLQQVVRDLSVQIRTVYQKSISDFLDRVF